MQQQPQLFPDKTKRTSTGQWIALAFIAAFWIRILSLPGDKGLDFWVFAFFAGGWTLVALMAVFEAK